MNADQEAQEKELPESKEASALLKEMRNVQSEAAQLAEIEELEREQALKLVESMKVLQAGVDAAVDIRPKSMGQMGAHMKQVVVGADAVLVGIDAEARSTSLPLSSLGPADILSVVSEWTPKLREKILAKKKDSEGRLYLMEKILREFKEGSAAIKNSRKQFYESVESDMVRDSIQKE